jgi:hypothetical protein
MSTPSNLSEYVLLIRNTGWYKGLSSEEIERCLDRFTGWAEQLAGEGKVKGGYPLVHAGKLIGSQKTITDGPFAESKEAIAGYILIQAASLEEAAEIAKGAPCLDYGQTLEVRAISSEVPELQIARRISVSRLAGGGEDPTLKICVICEICG